MLLRSECKNCIHLKLNNLITWSLKESHTRICYFHLTLVFKIFWVIVNFYNWILFYALYSKFNQ